MHVEGRVVELLLVVVREEPLLRPKQPLVAEISGALWREVVVGIGRLPRHAQGTEATAKRGLARLPLGPRGRVYQLGTLVPRWEFL